MTYEFTVRVSGCSRHAVEDLRDTIIAELRDNDWLNLAEVTEVIESNPKPADSSQNLARF
jgi:hypothetical protein